MSQDNSGFQPSLFDNLSFDLFPDNDALLEGVIVNNGGFDKLGRPTFVFPPNKQYFIGPNGKISRTDLVSAFEYLHSTIRTPDKTRGIVILLDFRDSNELLIDDILATLYFIKMKHPNIIQLLYIIQPQNRKTFTFLQEKLQLKQSGIIKRLRKINKKTVYPGFQVEIIKSNYDLKKYINARFLTAEFGGTLNYDHACWIKLNEDILEFTEEIAQFRKKIPDVFEKMKELYSYVNGELDENKDDLFCWIKNEFYDILENSQINIKFQHTDELLDKLSPRMDEFSTNPYRTLQGNPHIRNNRHFVIMIRGKLIEAKNHFNKLLDHLEMKIMGERLKSRLKEVGGEGLAWVQEYGMPLLSREPEYGNNLETAGTIARNFNNQVFNEGMKYISECSCNLCDLKHKTTITQNSRGSESEDSDLIRTAEMIIDEFGDKLQKRRKIYSEVYQFYLVYTRISKWIHRFINSLSIDLFQYTTSMNPEDLLPYSEAWLIFMDEYMRQNSSPQPAHLDLLEKVMPLIPDMDMRNGARLLIYKVDIILKLCNGKDLKIKEFREILDWKSQFEHDRRLKKFHDKCLELTSKQQVQKSFDSQQDIELKEKEAQITPRKPRQLNRNRTLETNLAISQPDLVSHTLGDDKGMSQSLNRSRDLIDQAESSVRESLRDTELIKEKDLRLSQHLNHDDFDVYSDDDQLSLILNQLLYDISPHM